jgi:2-C-methyl-D-erythritol 4-phosphate cytidylyltransferase
MDMALGTVVEVDRGSLPFTLIHGEALVAAAAWALGEAEVLPVDLPVTWDAIAEAGEPYVLHDALCPMTPPAFIAECVETALTREVVVVAVRPVTDTVKQVDGEVVLGTLDRDGLVEVVSPIVLPAGVVAALHEAPTTDFAALASDLARRFPIVTVPAPASAARVRTVEDVRILEALTTP